MGASSSNEAKDFPQDSNVVGIDLGTTFSSIAILKNGKAEVIPVKLGGRLTESEVFFSPNNTEVTVGKFAEHWSLQERTNFVYDAKRLMGRKYDDVYVQDLIRNGRQTYRIVRGEDDNAAIEIKQNNKLTKKLPEEIAAEILKYLKNSATSYLGETVTKAVISVPAHFNNAQRKATMRAAKLADIEVLKLISEPVAAAIYYSLDKINSKSTLLIVDIGGGTLDVSVVDVDDKTFKVRGLEGDSFLGGRDFDNNLMNHFFSTSLNDTGDASYHQRHLSRVRKACTKIKIMLSEKEETISVLDHFGRDENNSLPLTISRVKFESLNEDLFNRIMDIIEQCLADIGITKNDINQVVLVGGTSRIPKIQNMLGAYFGKGKLKTNVNPDEAIALGAAIEALVLSSKNNKTLEKYTVTEIAPLSIGVASCHYVMSVGISKNTPLPAKSVMSFTTTVNNQKQIRQDIYEGERKNCKFNSILGTLYVNNLPPKKAGLVTISTTFHLNADGILTIETSNRNQKSTAVVTLQEHRLNQNKIKSSFADAVRFKQEDELFANFMTYLFTSKIYSNQILYDLDKIKSTEKQEKVKKLCDNFIFYVNEAEDYEVNQKTFNDLKKTFQTLKQNVQPLIRGVIDVTDDTTNL